MYDAEWEYKIPRDAREANNLCGEDWEQCPDNPARLRRPLTPEARRNFERRRGKIDREMAEEQAAAEEANAIGKKILDES